MNTHRPISLLLCALGGEGGGVLSQWLVEAARIAGYPAQSTSIPGVAQRTGATTYYVEVFPQPLADLGGRRPVLSLNPVPGALDALVSSELLETTRNMAVASTDGTFVPDVDAESWGGRHNVAAPYTEEEHNMLAKAYQAIGSEFHDLNHGDTNSDEHPAVHTASPVKAFAGYPR